MSIFIVVYDRAAGELVRLEEFVTADRVLAENRRMELELEAAANGLQEDVVILEAASAHELLFTHGRYFKNLRELVTS